MDLSPGAVDPAIHKVTTDRFLRSMHLAELLGAGGVVFHSGYEKWKYSHNTDIWLEGSLKTWRPITAMAEDKGIQISIENIFEDNPANLRMLAEAIRSEMFGLCFDTGHFNLFSSIPLEEWLDMTSVYINELHLHDNDGTRDSHLSPGEGSFDFELLFRYLEEHKGEDFLTTFEPSSRDQAVKTIDFIRSRQL